MSKVESYIDLVDGLLKTIKFSQLNDEEYRNELAEKMVKYFEIVYGKKSVSSLDCIEDEGFAIIPALIKDSKGVEFLGLIDVCVMDSGEHYGTSVFTTSGIFQQGEDKEFNEVVGLPYNYRPLISIVGDIHMSAYY